MLHLRVIAPTESSESVLDVLRREVGVTHIVVHRGAALDPPGDEITADIARESANDVIDEAQGTRAQTAGRDHPRRCRSVRRRNHVRGADAFTGVHTWRGRWVGRYRAGDDTGDRAEKNCWER